MISSSADERHGVRLAVDIGGTFTDGVLVDNATGAVRVDKVPTTPGDPSEGFIRCVERLMTRGDVSPADFRFIVHATTVATNAILERRGAQVALLTTKGFRDVLEIARQIRYELYNLQTEKPRPLVIRANGVWRSTNGSIIGARSCSRWTRPRWSRRRRRFGHRA